MNRTTLRQIDDESLVREFARAANNLGSAINLWESGAKETEKLFAVRDEIRSRGLDVRLRLVPLLRNRSRFVQYYAAQQLMELEPERSRQIIEETARQGDAVAGDAGMFLYFVDSGVYKPR
jgi:hypothetical protein